MKIIKIGKVLVVISVVVLSFITCKKDKEKDDDTTSLTENAMADAAFTDVANISDEAGTTTADSLPSYRGEGLESVLTSCAHITRDTIATPHRITIDFGTTDCLCKDGNYRRGKIYVDYSGHYPDSASTHTISFDNYYVNYNKISGTKTVTNKGRNSSGHLSFTIYINGSITWDAQYGGGTSTHVSNRTREWVAGENTILNWKDDVYLISGTANGTNRSGGTYTMNTITPLRKRIGFRHFTEGVVDFTPTGKATRRIDYSYVNGSEDNLARVTINGLTYTITLIR